MAQDADTDYQPSPHVRNGFSLGDLIRAAKTGQATGLVTFGIILVAALAFLVTSQPLYTAEILITQKSNDSDLSAARSALSLIGGLSGASAGPPSEFKLFGALVTSNSLAHILDRKYGMVKVVFAKQWDGRAHAWVKPSGTAADLKAYVKSILQMPAWSPPDTRDLAQYLASNVQLVSSNPSLLATATTYSLRYSSDDPHFAANFLSIVFKEADTLLRERHEANLQKNIEYLQRRLTQTTEVGYREALIQLVADQEKQLMTLRSDAAYAAEIVDPAVPPKVPSFPKVKLTLILAVVLGASLAVVASIVHGLFWPNASLAPRQALRSLWRRMLGIAGLQRYRP